MMVCLQKKPLSRGFFSRVMVLCWILLLTTGTFLSAQTGTPKKFTVKFERTSVQEVLNYLEKNSDYDLLYNNKTISELPPVSLDVKDAAIEQVLNICFKGTNMTYEVNGMMIVIKLKKNATEAVTQMMRISGVVKDEQEELLPGVTVIVKGSKSGTATNVDGEFTLEYLKGDNVSLIFSFVGMKNLEIVIIRDGKVLVKDYSKLVVKMESDVEGLKEVVVTGYGNISKNSFTGSVTTISKEQLKTSSPTNLMNAIQYQDPSFRIRENLEMGSNPNTMPEMYIRGQSGIGVSELDKSSISQTSLNNNPNLPVFILDGFEVSVTKVYDLDINRVENITLLKDAAATAMYGSRAANGVVVITTVAPQPGKLNLSYTMDLGVSFPDLSYYNLMNAREKLEAEVAAGLFTPSDLGMMNKLEKIYNQKLQNIEQGVSTDWLALPLRNAVSHKHSVYIDGGSKDVRYGLDLKYDRQNGVMKESFREKTGFGFSLSYQVKGFLFKNYASYDGMSSQESPYGTFSEYAKMNPYDTYLDEHGRVVKGMKAWHDNSYRNPMYDATLGSFDKAKYREFYDNFNVRWYITPKLNVKGSITFNYKVDKTEKFRDPESTYFEGRTDKGDLMVTERITSGYDMSTLLFYVNQLDKHYVNLSVGINMKESVSDYTSMYYTNFPEGGFSSPDFAGEMKDKPVTAYDKDRLFGALLTLNYTYNNIYLFDISGRLDGSSQFGTEKKYAPFGAGGIGVNIHNYNFINKRMPWLDQLKVRASYGLTGKVNFPSYTAQTKFFFVTDGWYTTGHAAELNYMGNPNLQWEKTVITDVGAELSLFKGIFYMKYTYYVKQTKDLIADMFIPTSSGFNSYKENVGEMENRGHEINLRARILGKKDILLYVFANGTSNKNELTKLSNSMKSYNDRVNQHFSENQLLNNKPLLKYYEGASMTSIYGMRSRGIDPATGKEHFVYSDGSTGFTWEASENVVIGDTEPTMSGSFGFNLNFRGITLDSYFMYEWGGQVYNQTLVDRVELADPHYNCDKRVLTDRWRQAGDVTNFKDIKAWQRSTQPSSRFIQDYNWCSLSSLSLGYEFPARMIQKLRLSRLKVQLNAKDLFTISTVKMEKGLSYPFARAFNFTLSAAF